MPEESCPSCSPCSPGAIAPQTSTLVNQECSDADEHHSKELATLCKALGHPARVQILKILIARQSCICGEIVDVMPLAQSTVSEHLRILKKAGLVQGDVDGTRICYCINPVILTRLKFLINAF